MELDDLKEGIPDLIMDEKHPDPCPLCNKEMRHGDWVCWGFCYKCYEEQT